MKRNLENRKLENWQVAEYRVRFIFSGFEIVARVMARSDWEAEKLAGELVPVRAVDFIECDTIETKILGVYHGTKWDECPAHEGAFDCPVFCRFCGGEQFITPENQEEKEEAKC